MALTPAMEDYLEAVLMMQKRHGYVRCVDVAEHLGVKKPSVSRAVKELSKSGHLVKNADGTLSLTEWGLQFAEQIYEKHLFFTQQLLEVGISPELAELDACRMEHVISQESFEHLKNAYKGQSQILCKLQMMHEQSRIIHCARQRIYPTAALCAV